MVKNLPASAGDTGSIPGSGRSSGERNGNPLLYSCLGNFMDRGAWLAIQSMGLQRVGHNISTKQQQGERNGSMTESGGDVRHKLTFRSGVLLRWASLVAQLVKNRLQYGRPGFDPWVGKTPWRREGLPTPVF